jgi:hypothetical protein
MKLMNSWRRRNSTRPWDGLAQVAAEAWKRAGWMIGRAAAVGLIGLVFVLAGCASKDYYRDEYGAEMEGVPDYNYHNGNAYAAPTANAGEPASDYAGEQPAHTAYDWPRVFVQANTTNTIYQPQIESWDGHTLTARSGVSVQAAGQPQAVFGIITFQGATSVSSSNRTLKVEKPRIVAVEFPSQPDKARSYRAMLQEDLGQQAQVYSLGSLQGELAANRQQQTVRAQPLDNAPPQIVFANQPSILVSIDGTPAYEPAPGTDLDRVINTRVLLLKNRKSGTFYLHVLNGYMQAPTLEGPWRVGAPPPGAAAAENRFSGEVDLLEGQPNPTTQLTPKLSDSSAPLVFVATRPTELITFDGEPDFVPIPGTALLYVTNTTGNVFKLLSDQQTYVLLSGRWYRAPSFRGPWQFVAGNELPGDFARIPDTSPKENVKASIPGTAQAKEAVIANSIPKTTPVAKNAQIPAPQIDGAPQLVAIAGTPLFYVANSSVPIIEVDPHSWYACEDGVWYVATSVAGPWVVAASVPAVIYSIPPSCPVHYVTYVRVYNTTPDIIYAGYTPGYLGTVVAPYGVVVYGTGYYYPPWVDSFWFGWPATWGFGWDPFWTPWSGWCFGIGFGWPRGYYYFDHFHHHWLAWHPPRPRWGPFHRPGRGFARHEVGAQRRRRFDRTSLDIYHGASSALGPMAKGFEPGPLSRGYYGRAYNSRTGNLVAGEPGRVRNVFHPPPGQIRGTRFVPQPARRGFFDRFRGEGRESFGSGAQPNFQGGRPEPRFEPSFPPRGVGQARSFQPAPPRIQEPRTPIFRGGGGARGERFDGDESDGGQNAAGRGGRRR